MFFLFFFFPFVLEESKKENKKTNKRKLLNVWGGLVWDCESLLLGFLLCVTRALLGLGPLALHTTSTASTVGRGEGEVNVLLGVKANNVGGDINDLLADANVTLLDEDTCVVDRLGKTELEHLGLETTLQEVVNLEAENVIELLLGLVQDTDADQTADERVSLEETLGALVLKGQELTGSLADLGKGERDTVDLIIIHNCEKKKFRLTHPKISQSA